METDTVALDSQSPVVERRPPPQRLVQVELKFLDSSWVDVRDAGGKRLAYGNISEGRLVSIKGKPPFSVFLGNADGVRIEYGGEPFDFSSFTNGIYARFQLGTEQGNP